MGGRIKRIVEAVSLTLTVGACGAADAGTPCHHDYHCISGSCTIGTCDAFPSCWPNCDEHADDSPGEAPTPNMRDAASPTLDASFCKLRLCAELSLAECRVEPGCELTTRCADASVPDPPWTRSFTDGGHAAACLAPERCLSSLWSSDLRVHPLGSCF